MSNKIRAICDAARRTFVGDDAYWAQNLVTSTFSHIFEKEYPQMGWLHGGLLAMRQEVDPGAKEYNYLQSE